MTSVSWRTLKRPLLWERQLALSGFLPSPPKSNAPMKSIACAGCMKRGLMAKCLARVRISGGGIGMPYWQEPGQWARVVGGAKLHTATSGK